MTIAPKSACKNRIRAYWNGTEILDGTCSTVIACQIIESMAEEFAGLTAHNCRIEAHRVAIGLLNGPAGAATHFYFDAGAENGCAEVRVNF